MYKKELALNDLQWLICHKTKPIIISHMSKTQCAFTCMHNVYISKCIYTPTCMHIFLNHQKRPLDISVCNGFFYVAFQAAE